MPGSLARRVSRFSAAPVVAVVLLLGALLAPAIAAGSWATLHQTHRHVKSQACKYWFGTAYGKYAQKYIDTRGNTRNASTGAHFDVSYNINGLVFHYGWMKWVPRGRVVGETSQWVNRGEFIKVRMRTKTPYGVSRWSRWYSFAELPTCPR